MSARDSATRTGPDARRGAARCSVAVPRGCAWRLVLAAAAALGFARGQDAPPAPAGPSSHAPHATSDPQEPLDALIDRMGSDDYAEREAAMRAIIGRGPAAADVLRERLEREPDAEIRHRIRYILAAILMPDEAVLVLRAWPESGLAAGDVVTHVDHRRVRRPAELARLVRRRDLVHVLRVNGRDGPRELSEFNLEALVTTAGFRAPRGPRIAEIVRLYAQGMVEQADERMRELPAGVPPAEFPPLLQAIIAHTAGRGTAALELLDHQIQAAEPTRPDAQPWQSPSLLDLAGPFKAPYRLEAILWEQALAAGGDRNTVRDRALQRVYVAANRRVETLVRAAAMWHTEMRAALSGNPRDDRSAGNMLAVVGWMCSDVGLLSECVRVIEPRSWLLEGAPGAPYTWVRVQLRGWTTFLAGRPAEALDQVYDDARTIMKTLDTQNTLIRNPDVAAQVAFFLYQVPDDPRVGEMLETVTIDPTNPGYLALPRYAWWMCCALHPANADRVRADLARLPPHMPDEDAARFARAAIMLEYVADRPDMDVMDTLRPVIEKGARFEEGAEWLAACDAMRLLARGQVAEAAELLDRTPQSWITDGLRSTARFRADPPAAAAQDDALRACLLAVPTGADAAQWIVLTRGRELLLMDGRTGQRTPVDAPTANWYPGPLNWPWVGREASTGRTWVYGLRRIREVGAGADPPLRVNIDAADVPAFARYVGPVFSALRDALAGVQSEPGENGEFLRAEISAGGEYFADPDLPAVGLIQPVPFAEGFVHVAVRGGPHLLVERSTGRCWSSDWLAQQLGLDRPPAFFVRAAPRPEPAPLFLMSDQGLIRVEPGRESAQRIPLPGDDPFPALVPESAPYVRRDPRWVYVARLPDAPGPDGGRVYRLTVETNAVEALDMVNEALPPEYDRVLSRAALRAEIDRRLEAAGAPPLVAVLDEARRAVAAKYRLDRPADEGIAP